MTEPDFKSTTGHQTSASVYNWTGDVWTETNMPIISGLRESGRPDLAAELNWSTIRAFNGDYREALLPSSGQGLGAKRYAESAAQYIQGVIENLFGIEFDTMQKSLRIAPMVPKSLYGKEISVRGVAFPADSTVKLSMKVRQTSKAAAVVTVDIEGPVPEGTLEVEMPGSTQQLKTALSSHFVARLH